MSLGAMDTKGPDFMFEGMLVGFFKTDAAPAVDGSYSYEPYRGPGHSRMQAELRRSGSARCYYLSGSQRVSFTVSACPEYGMLQLRAFQPETAGAGPPAQKPRAFLPAGLAALPTVVLLAMNTLSWGTTDLDTIVLAFQIATYAGLAIALLAIYLAIRQFRRGGSYAALGISVAIALGFIVWAGPDAYLDLAAALSGAGP
jgi:hypothetical protein